MMELEEHELLGFNETIQKIREEIEDIVIGQGQTIELLLAGLFSGGHVLLEGVPGIAKTLLARLLSSTLSADFSRIQFTPDLMPSDVLGSSVFNMKTSEFYFRKGPVFSNIILIDEINRSPAKTQAALMEVMEERNVTIDGQTYKMDFPFFVVATQNPIEQEGTYRLPEAQLDRFIFRIRMTYPTLEDEKMILRRFREESALDSIPSVQPILSNEQLRSGMEAVNRVHISDELCDYVASIVHHSRTNGSIYLGASPRASLAIMRSSKAIALMNGRSFVVPDDVQKMAYPVLNHRIILSPERELEGVESEQVIEEILAEIEVPR